MPQNRKPARLLLGHISTEERTEREQYETGLISGEVWKEYPETKNNVTAHKFFERLTGLYERIGKNDAITEPVINRYCLLQAECTDFERKRDLFHANLESLLDCAGMDDSEKFKLQATMQRSIIAADQQVMSKRRMLLEIEKEMLLTLKAQLSAIPPKAPDKPRENKFFTFERSD